VIVRPLSPIMGTEIIGMDLARPLSAEERAQVDDAFNRYMVLCFRDQTLTMDELVAFSRTWGPLTEHTMPGQLRDGITAINIASNAGPDGTPNGRHPDLTAMRWHTDRSWRVDPAQLGQPFAGRAALLSPFDRLIADRKRMSELFEFDYVLEMYKPAAARRWGYYALPILYGDRLVGKLDARADFQAGALHVLAIHGDVPFTKAMTSAVDREITDLARWLDLELDRPA